MGEPVSVLVVGGGMYVTGRGAPGSRGTILPALFEARRAGTVGDVGIVTTRPETARAAAEAAARLADDMGVDGTVSAFPDSETANDRLMAAIDQVRPDAAIVSVPDHLHADVCVPLIERGIHCLVVKPLAGSTDDAQRMISAADQAGVVAQVEFHKRLDESNVLLRDAVRSGRLGTPLYAVIEYSQRKVIPEDVFRAWATDSNIFQYLGVHYVDLLFWATGFTPKRVTAWGQKSYLVQRGVETWDSMQVVIEWETGGAPFVSTHITNWIDPNSSSAMSDQKINIVGTAGRFQADQKNRGVQIVTDDSGVEDVNPYFTVSHRSGEALHFSGYGIASVRQFIDDVAAVTAGRMTVLDLPADRPTFHHGGVSTAVIEAASNSLDAGSIPSPVTLPEQFS